MEGREGTDLLQQEGRQEEAAGVLGPGEGSEPGWWPDGVRLTGLARTPWVLTPWGGSKSPEGLDIAGGLKRMDTGLASAPEPARWTMNFCLGELGINHAEFRDEAIAIGERVGAYRDYPTSKGCISPFVPLWVAAIVERQG